MVLPSQSSDAFDLDIPKLSINETSVVCGLSSEAEIWEILYRLQVQRAPASVFLPSQPPQTSLSFEYTELLLLSLFFALETFRTYTWSCEFKKCAAVCKQPPWHILLEGCETRCLQGTRQLPRELIPGISVSVWCFRR